MNPVRTKHIAIVALIAGAIMAVGGLALCVYGEMVPGIVIAIAGVFIAMIGRVILSLFSKFEFHRMVSNAGKNKKE